MYKNLAAVLAAACFFSPALSQKQPKRSSRSKSASSMSRRSPTRAGCTSTNEGRQAVEAAFAGKVKTTLRRERAGRPRRRARDPRPGPAGQQADLHAQLRLHGADAEGGQGISRRQVRIHHRLQDGAQRRGRQCALLRRPLPGGHRRRPHDQDQRGRLRGRLPDSRSAARHQRLHAGHAFGQPEGAGQGGVAQRLVRPAARARCRHDAVQPGRGRDRVPHGVRPP